MEVDRLAVMLSVPVPAGHQLEGLDLAVDPLRRRVGDAVFEVGQDVREVALQRLGRRDDRLEPRVRRPEVPRLEVLPCPRQRHVAPERAQRLLDRPRPTRLQIGLLDGLCEISANFVYDRVQVV